MIRLSNIKLPCSHTEEELKNKLYRVLHLKRSVSFSYQIVRRSIDARKKPEIFFVYVIDVKTAGEEKLVRQLHHPEIIVAPSEQYCFPKAGNEPMQFRPVIVGFGPAGLFCGYLLAQYGYAPIILERGGDVEERSRLVAHFWQTGELDIETNVSFGEGGAGTFSDGKLNTLVKDKYFRNRKVLELFVKHGAPEEILYLQKPHIGTDILRSVVKSMREEIKRLGGEVYFHAQVTDIKKQAGGILSGIVINGKEELACNCLVLAAGHSARDTFTMLSRHLVMQPKSFAVGLRIEHPQTMINCSQYGAETVKRLGAADYKLTYQTKNGRGVYSFCMCPGGFVVNASSENGRLAINGMSNHARNEKNANAAIIVTVTPDDFGKSVLSGIEFQRRLEEKAYRAGSGKIPVQLYRDFEQGCMSTGLGEVVPCMKGDWSFGNLNDVLPKEISDAIKEAMPSFGVKIKGFDREDAVFSGIESRTSSPLRIMRDELGEANIKGIYPCGEGAGYAGGITSAAMDGILIAEKIAERYAPYKKV